MNFKIAKVVMFGLLMVAGSGVVVSADEATIKLGKEVVLDRKKGNCLACHIIEDGPQPGNQGPPLVAMSARFPDREVLKAHISNPLEFNPNTVMPPFGLHNIVSESEIDAIVDYLLTL